MLQSPGVWCYWYMNCGAVSGRMVLLLYELLRSLGSGVRYSCVHYSSLQSLGNMYLLLCEL